jgi:hypothetical protein
VKYKSFNHPARPRDQQGANMKVMIRKAPDGQVSAYVAKKDLE